MLVLAHQITHFFPHRRNPLDKTAWETNDPGWRPEQLLRATCLEISDWRNLWRGRNSSRCHISKAKGCWWFTSSYCKKQERIGGAFTVFPQFRSNYSATIPATLNLRRAVAEEPDFIYSIEVSFLRNNLPQPGLKDVVQVKVRGKHLKLF